MSPLAVARLATPEKLKQIPPDVWLGLALVIAVFMLAVLVLRRVARMNKVLVAVVTLVVLTVLFFSWIYNRNEPKFLTPVIDRIAPWFPSKDTFGQKQQDEPSS